MMAPQFNAGEDYIRQLAAQSRSAKQRRARDEHKEPAPQHPSPPMRAGNLDAELATLDAQVAELENKLKKRQATVEEAGKEVEGIDPKKREALHAEASAQLAALERLNRAYGNESMIDDSSLDQLTSDVAAAEEKLREEDAEDPLDIDHMKAKLQRHVEVEMAPRVVEEELEEAQEIVEPPPAPPARDVEAERLRIGLIEMKLETERYAAAIRKLHEKHEQMMITITQKYMAGLE